MRTTIAGFIWIVTTVTAMADTGPVFVVPSRPGVPIVINGMDASYAVVEGEWGLGKDVRVQPTVYYGWPVFAPPPVGRYFPRTGHAPGYGRHEINTAPRRLPQAEPFERSWGAESPRGFEPIPSEPPPILYAPDFRDRYRRSR